MAHGMLKNDGAVFAQKQAWHGLGVVVDEAPTTIEALELAGLNWQVQQAPLVGIFGEGQEQSRQAVESHVCNYRDDDNTQLGVVSSNFSIIQNNEVADFADALAQEGDRVRVESCGSIKGGRKIYMLLRGQSFSVRNDDEVVPYYLLANAHDGTMSFRALPTSIRVVCQNTLHAALGRKSQVGYTIRHTSKAMDRVSEARRALGLYQKEQDAHRENIQTLADRDVSREQIQAFWLESYQRDFGAVPVNPSDSTEERRRDRAMEAVNKMAERFDRERDLAGASAWNALNAYTGWVQHDRPTRSDRKELNLLGNSSKMTSDAFGKALATLAA